MSHWFGKRAAGALNLLAGRGKVFEQAQDKLLALQDFIKGQNIDLLLCSGDYTALGLESELQRAAKLIEPLSRLAPLGLITVAGNHDLYTRDTVQHGYFERYFGFALSSDLPEYRADGVWPLVRLFDDRIAVIAVNSSKPNPLPWHSDGAIPQIQLEAMRRILQDPRVKNRFVFAMTHYAPRLHDGQPDRPMHGLSNADEYLEVCSEIPRGALLCGHVHYAYRTPLEHLNADLFCAGSLTKQGNEGFWLFDVSAKTFTAQQGEFDPLSEQYRLQASSD